MSIKRISRTLTEAAYFLSYIVSILAMRVCHVNIKVQRCFISDNVCIIWCFLLTCNMTWIMFFLAVWISALFNDNVSIQQCPGVPRYIYWTMIPCKSQQHRCTHIFWEIITTENCANDFFLINIKTRLFVVNAWPVKRQRIDLSIFCLKTDMAQGLA